MTVWWSTSQRCARYASMRTPGSRGSPEGPCSGTSTGRPSREVMQQAPDELSIHEILITVPQHDPFPPALQGRRAVFLVPVHVGGEEQAAADLAPLRELGPAFDLVGPMPYLALQSMIDH